MIAMLRDLERQKEATKKKLLQRIDEYYDEFSKGSDRPDFKINQIEDLMLDNRKRINDILEEANGELTGSIEIEDKKNALNAKGN